MKNESTLIDKLDNRYFWDVNVSDINPVKSKRLIIERVFTLGDVKDIKLIIEYYGKQEVVAQLMKLPYLDAKTLNFASTLFNKPKNEFRCSTKMRSIENY